MNAELFRQGVEAEEFVKAAFTAWFATRDFLPVSFLKNYGRGKVVTHKELEQQFPGAHRCTDMNECVDFDLAFSDVTIRVDVKTTSKEGYDCNFSISLSPKSDANMYACVFQKDLKEGKAKIYMQKRSVVEELIRNKSVKPSADNSGKVYYLFDMKWFECVDMTDTYNEYCKPVPDKIKWYA